jgi:hypothetical protein
MGKPIPGLLLLAVLTVSALVGIWGTHFAQRAAPPHENVAAAGDASLSEDAGDAEEEDEAESQPPELSDEPWDDVETVGEEGELVEVIYNDESEWEMVGWRVKGVGLYDAPEFWVPARKWDDVPLFPCSDCHGEKQPYNPEPRALVEEHEDVFVKHGNERFWCTDCHGGEGMDYLVSRRGKPIDIDLGHVFCGECHFDNLKDFEHGVHGRRIGFHTGPRVLRTCTECHNAHQPQILAEKPDAPPRFRENLKAFAPPDIHRVPVWERFGKGNAP